MGRAMIRVAKPAKVLATKAGAQSLKHFLSLRKSAALSLRRQDSINEAAILEQALSEGMMTLTDSARELVLQGDTSVEELIRVVATGM